MAITACVHERQELFRDAAVVHHFLDVLTTAATAGGCRVPVYYVFFLGSDDFPAEAKAAAARDLNDALVTMWPGFETIQMFALSEIAAAHESVESRKARGRVVVTLQQNVPRRMPS